VKIETLVLALGLYGMFTLDRFKLRGTWISDATSRQSCRSWWKKVTMMPRKRRNSAFCGFVHLERSSLILLLLHFAASQASLSNNDIWWSVSAFCGISRDSELVNYRCSWSL